MIVYLDQAITQMGFSIRKTIVSQEISDNWQQLPELGAKRVHEALKEAKADVVLAADETLIRFHETNEFVIGLPATTSRTGRIGNVAKRKKAISFCTGSILGAACLDVRR